MLHGNMSIHSIGLSLMLAAVASAQIQQETVLRGREATALVELPSGLGFGTAFCIDAQGYFVTNAHVVGEEDARIKLVLNAGGERERSVFANVVRLDEDADLALLEVVGSSTTSFPSLPLGSDASLSETQVLAVFGYPFGTQLALNQMNYPSITINVGRITALRRTAARLETIQFDADVNPGNSGGPVLDETGRVVGVVQEKVANTAVNFAIPVSRLQQFLLTPEIVFRPPTVMFRDRDRPVDLEFELVSFTGEQQPFELELTLRPESPNRSTLTLARDDDGMYRTSAVLVPSPEPLRLAVTVRYDGGQLSGYMQDQRIRFGGSIQQLSEMQRLAQVGRRWQAVRFDGRSAVRDELMFSNPQVDVGGAALQLDLEQIRRIDVSLPEAVEDRVAYTVEARLDGSSITRQRGELVFEGLPRSDKEEPAEDTEPAAGMGLVMAAPLPSGQPKFEEDEVLYQLPEPYAAFAVGGADRYWIFHLKEARKVVVFDVLQAEIVHEIPSVEEGVLLCAGAEHLMLVMPSQRLVHRWNLNTFQREQTTRLSIPDSPRRAVMGSNATQTFLIRDGNQAHLMDVSRLQATSLEPPLFGGRHDYAMRVSADGRTIGAIPTGFGPVAYQLVHTHESLLLTREFAPTSSAIRWAQPSADGRLVFLPGGAVYNALLDRVSAQWLDDSMLYPTVDPRYFLSVRNVTERRGGEDVWTTQVNFCTAADCRIIYSYTGLEEISPARGDNTQQTNEKRRRLSHGEIPLSYIPWANLLVNLDHERQNIYVRRFDLKQAIEDSGEHYLYVTSIPPLGAVKGRGLSYRIDVESNAENVTFSLLEGPQGMTVSRDGLVRWTPARDVSEGFVGAVVGISRPDGSEIYHSFELLVVENRAIRGRRVRR